MIKDYEDYNEYEDKIQDVDEIAGTDVKINPDFYIHIALITAQKMLAKDDIKNGFLQFRIQIDYLAVLCRSAQYLDINKYEDEIRQRSELINLAEEKDDFVKKTKEAIIKLGVLTENIFGNKVSTKRLKI